MKILYVLKRDPDKTLQNIMGVHRKAHDLTVIDIRKDKDYIRLVDMIEYCDRIISW